MFGGKLGVPELLIILGIAVLFFGPGRLGDLGRSLGDAIGNFKHALKDAEPAPAAVPVAEQQMADGGQRSQQ